MSESSVVNRPLKMPGRLIGVAGMILGLLAFAAPLLRANVAFLALGLLILTFGLLQNVWGFARRDPSSAGSWFSRGGTSIVTGLLLIAMPKMTFAGLAVVMGLSWVVSGGSAILSAVGRRERDWTWTAIDGAVSVVLGLAIAIQWPVSGLVSVGLFVGLRFLTAGWATVMGTTRKAADSPADDPDLHPDAGLGLDAHPYLGALRKRLTEEEVIRGKNDRVWCSIFLVTFFAIHFARMDTDWSLVGFLSPVGAVLGDSLFAILLAYGLVAPFTVTWHRLTRPLERRGWKWLLTKVDDPPRGLRFGATRGLLTRRMRSAVRNRQARGSPTAMAGWGLRTGLPAAALLMALTPLWGVNWVFDTETWVTGAWEIWAEHRTDTWREQGVRAVRAEYGESGTDPEFLRLRPEGLDGAGDFSFVVIGDTGEGDASQLILKDQVIEVGRKPEVKFLVVSSDVIYPSGAMKHYEPKFYLPFKGFRKPIYAVPGNHDWYDALDSFTANFFEPKAARAAMRGRREADHGLTVTTESRIDEMIREAESLRGEYGIQAARQRAPYFEILTETFSLIVVDTGIMRKIDDDQMTWLDAALERGRGRFRMVILGHPLYAAGQYQAAADPDFARLHEKLKAYDIPVVMAGDTHDFEFYREPAGDSRRVPTTHFVNGGGGAYLSIGTALSWPVKPPVASCGHYPRADELTAALDARMPTWKQPMWYWVKRLGAWPASPESVAAGFDYDRAPFFQSFVEVRVEGSANLVRLWLYGANGRLRWRDLSVTGPIPHGKTGDDFVEFSYPLKP